MNTLYTTPIADVVRLDGGILKENWTVTKLYDAQLVKDHLKISQEWQKKEEQVLILVEGSGVNTMAKACRDTLASHYDNNEPNAIALLLRSALSRVIGTLLIAVKRPKFPMKLFSDEQKASF